MNLTPFSSASHWSAKYVGLAWALLFNCWHLVALVQLEVFGRVAPIFDPSTREDDLRAVVAASGWRRTKEAAQDGDVLLMHGPDGPHIGVIVVLDRRTHLLHNLGGVDEASGKTLGSVRLDPVDKLGSLQYGRLELWRAPQC